MKNQEKIQQFLKLADELGLEDLYTYDVISPLFANASKVRDTDGNEWIEGERGCWTYDTVTFTSLVGLCRQVGPLWPVTIVNPIHIRRVVASR